MAGSTERCEYGSGRGAVDGEWRAELPEDTVRYLPAARSHRPGVARKDPARLQTSPRRAYMLLRACIRSGTFDRDQQLIERELVDMLGTSRNAVRLALQMLARDGLVSRGPKNGTSVIGGIVRLAMDHRLPLGDAADPAAPANDRCSGFQAQLLEMRLVPSTPYLRRRLQVHTDCVTMCEHLVSYGTEPISVRVGYLPPGLAAGGLEVWWQKRAEAFERRFKVPFGYSEDSVEATGCEVRTAKLLGVEEGSPILLRETLFVGFDGVPCELTYNYNRGDRSSLFISTRGDTSDLPPAT